MKVKDWLDRVINNPLRENYPNLICGWPDKEHGICHSDYITEALTKIEDLDEDEDIPPFPSFKEWVEDERDKNQERDNLGFSWGCCDLCGAAPGNRYAVTAFDSDLKDYVGLSVCEDCLCYIANGDIPEWVEED